MNKNILLSCSLILFLLSCASLRAQTGYFKTLSKPALYELVVSDTISTHDALWIRFRFKDNLGVVSTKVSPAWMLYKQLKGKMPKDAPYTHYRKLMMDALLTNKPLAQSQWGNILAYDVLPDTLVSSYARKGIEAFADQFFEHRNAFKEWDYNVRRPQVVAAAFELGLLVRLTAGNNYLHPACSCRLKKVIE